MKSSAGLSDALLVMVAMLLLSGLVKQTTAEYLAFRCVTVAKSRRLAKDIGRPFDSNQST